MDLVSGEWRHHTHLTFKDRKWLGHISYKTGEFINRSTPSSKIEEELTYYQSVMSQAHDLIRGAKAAALKAKVPDQTLLFQGSKAEKLRWMALPSEAKDLLLNTERRTDQCRSPFSPKKFSKDEKVRCSYGSLQSKTDLRVNSTLLSVRVTKPSKKSSTVVNGRVENAKEPSETETEGSVTATQRLVSCTDGSCALEENSRPKPEVVPFSDITSDPKVTKWHSPPKSIFKPFTEAVEDFGMVKNGDRVLERFIFVLLFPS